MTHQQTTPVAVIGMGCFFPKSPGLKEYWRLLFHGEDAITEVPETHWSAEDYFDNDPKRPDHVYCKRGGFLSPIPFDPSEFGIPPASLEATDTSQLLALTAAKRALEDAGYGENRKFDRDKVSVVLGVTGTQELVIPLGARLGHPKWRKALKDAGIPPDKAEEVIERIGEAYVPWQENSFPGLLGNVVAGRICNRLDLGGTNCVVDAACASSMSAIHLALLELTSGRSDMVVSGGVDALNDIFMHTCFAKTMILSPTGNAKPFSKDADGTILGEGLGLLVLKRLDDAQRDGDRIYAVIKGLGSSSDGKSQSIYAPRKEGQIKAIRKAYDMAGISSKTIELIEAHGTGTRVGDAVEFNGLKEIFADHDGQCAIGSVKSMIGHTKAAAGAAGLVKTVLSLYHKVLPPTLKADEPDPNLGIEQSPFYLNPETRPWFSRKDHPRRSGVSAFGFGGSNFHAVLEEYDSAKQEIAWDGSVEIIALSASTQGELANTVQTFRRETKGISEQEFSAKAYQSRQIFSADAPHRILLVIEQNDDKEKIFTDALTALETKKDEASWAIGNMFYSSEKPGKMAFIFPGQGSQYVNMGKDITCVFPQAFEFLENANEKIDLPERLTDFIYPIRAKNAEEKAVQEEQLRSTDIAQPAIGAVSAAMFKVLEWFGLNPEVVLGHSYGELCALYAAGRVDTDTFFELSELRGKLMAEASRKNAGTMLAVKAPLEKIEQMLEEEKLDLVLANRNSPDQGVLSGSFEAIAQAEMVCKQRGFGTKRLPVSAAFHSLLMKDAWKIFTEALKKIHILPSHISVLSNVSAKEYPDDADSAKKLLGDQILSPVDFVNEIKYLFNLGVRTFVEVGPKTVLTGLIKSVLKGLEHQALSMDASSGRRFGIADLAKLLCHIAALGHVVDLKRWEYPAPTSRKQKMSIPICGANYRSKQKAKQYPLSKLKDSPEKKATPEVRLTPAVSQNIARASNTAIDSRKAVNTMTRKEISAPRVSDGGRSSSYLAGDALKAVQEGLKSMQILHQQTALTHQKFLETQTEASRTLQRMMENTQRIAEISMGMPVPEYRPAVREIQPVQSEPVRMPIPEIPKLPKPPEIRQSMPDPPKIQAVKIQPTDPPKIQETGHRAKIESTLLEVVSQLTGYPTDMLSFDMDIESDLGIDSIKRVEILSSFEERMPGLPSISPEMMGTLKTLGQIVDHLAQEQSEKCQVLSVKCQVLSEKCQVQNEKIKDTLLEVVSQLTGYPADMLSFDMDIESDLGIDSIKRVEILSSFEEKMPGLPSISPEMMGTLKTLGQIADYLADAPNPPAPFPEREGGELSSSFRGGAGDGVSPLLSGEGQGVGLPERRMVSLVNLQAEKGEPIRLPFHKTLLIADDNSGLGEALIAAFKDLNINASLISPEILIKNEPVPAICGLVILGTQRDPNAALLKDAFLLARRFGQELITSAKNGGAVFACVSAMDGGFGFKGLGISDPMQGGLAGLVKTAAIEWEGVTCHAIDISSQEKSEEIAKDIASEILSYSPIEIALSGGQRFTLTLESAPYSDGKIALDSNDVVIITGGARGVTAQAAYALAQDVKPVFALLGRSPEPTPEPQWLSVLEDEAQIKRAILDNQFGGHSVSPMQLEKAFKQHKANREILSTIEKLKSMGAQAIYRCADVRNADMIFSIFNEIRSDYGAIKAIIHGAGILEDRLITDKTPEQFERVFDTKVLGLKNLLDATKDDPLKYIVLFSSVSARMGNKGQADYAMANEVLNKTAQQQAVLRPDVRVISINWGPWDGGMVSSALKREFARQGVSLIPLEAGAMAMVREMSGDRKSPVEVVIGSGFDMPAIAASPPPLSLAVKREFDIQQLPILRSHILGGKAVVPFALMTEWLGHSALHENPGLFLHGLDDIRLLQGIKITEEKRLIRLLAGKAKRNGAFYEVNTEIRDGQKGDSDMVHFRAKAILADTPSHQAPAYVMPSDMKKYSRSMDEIYENILFHGIELRGIREIISCSPKSMTAKISAAPSPSAWMKEPLRSRWISDPMVLDCAFQMAIVWCFEEKGVLSLPSYAASYRQYRSQFPTEGVTAVLEIRDTNAHKMKGDFTFLDANQTVIAQLTDYEAVMDASLFKAFKA